MKSGSPEYVKCVLADKGVSYMFKVVNTGEVGSLAKQWKAQGWTEVVVSRCGDRLRSVVGYRNEILGPSPSSSPATTTSRPAGSHPRRSPSSSLSMRIGRTSTSSPSNVERV